MRRSAAELALALQGRCSKRAMPDGNAGRYGNDGNVVSVSYGIYVLGVAVHAAEPREAAGQEAAAEERPELVFNEPWKAMAIAQPRGLGEEALDMLPDHRYRTEVLGSRGAYSKAATRPLVLRTCHRVRGPNAPTAPQSRVATRRCCVLKNSRP